MSRTITLIGARGGSGTSTAAAVLAGLAATETTVVLASHDPTAMAHLLAVPAPLPGTPVTVGPNLTLAGDPEEARGLRPNLRVIDAGTLADPVSDGNEDARYLVVRGPCYLALATLVGRGERNFDGVVLLTEPGRAMSATDVAEVTGLPVVASVPVHPRVARCLDAGLLPSRLVQLAEFGELRALAGLQVELHRTAVGRDRRRAAGVDASDVPVPSQEVTR